MIELRQGRNAEIEVASAAPSDRYAPTLLAVLESAHGCSFDQATQTVTVHGGPHDGRRFRESSPGKWELVPETEKPAA